jgi:alpha-ketoglutarate-dependent taurine dioxygenase
MRLGRVRGAVPTVQKAAFLSYARLPSPSLAAGGRILKLLSGESDRLLTVEVVEGDQAKSLQFPYSFLRDNCNSNFHPSTLQRLNAMNNGILASRPKSLTVVEAAVGECELEIEWETPGCSDTDVTAVANESPLSKISRYSTSWLLDHSLTQSDRLGRRFSELQMIEGLTASVFFEQKEQEPVDFSVIIPPEMLEREIELLKKGEGAGQESIHSADDHIQPIESDSESEKELVRLFTSVWRHGLCFVNNVPSEFSELKSDFPVSCVAMLAKRVSFLRQTNYGNIFNVLSKQDANNQAYTSQSLPLHTDLPFYRNPPDIQFLHCINPSSSTGGESAFCDGVAAADRLRDEDYPAYRLLCDTPLRYDDYSHGKWFLLDEKPVIQEVLVNRGNSTLGGVNPTPEGARGESARGESAPLSIVTSVFYNEGVRSRVCNSLAAEEVDDFFSALVKFKSILETDEALRIEFRMGKDEMCVFNNNRVLHGRSSFGGGGNTGEGGLADRYLQGAYVDWDDVLSRMRLSGAR